MAYNKRTGQYTLTFTLSESDHDEFMRTTMHSKAGFLRDALEVAMKRMRLIAKQKDIGNEAYLLRKDNEEIELFNSRVTTPIELDQYGNWIQQLPVDMLKQD